MKLIKNVRLVMADEIVEDKGVLFSDRIEAVVSQEEFPQLEKEKMKLEVIDGKGLYLSPGFIDIHIHGSAGRDTMDASREALDEISRSLAGTGVTSFLATTMTMPEKDIKKALEGICSSMKKGTSGAGLLGAHVEGPFISPEYKGAQVEKDIKAPDMSLLADYLDIIRLLTIAPELEGAEKLIRSLNEKGITVSVGHSAASYEEVIEAQKWGVTHTTHLFNAMTGLHHRRPGIVGAVLTSEMSCELIADLIHIHPAVLRLVLQTKDLDQIILVTDQMEAGCLEEGEYSLGGQRVIVKDGSARLENGQLAGSILTLNKAVRNILKISDLTLPEVIQMVTVNPARRLGLEDELGRLVAGCRADLVMFNDDIEINRVFVGGKIVV